MKYIRTKDGIYEVLDKETDICILTNHAWKYKSDIITQADTIEELCDEFVSIKDNETRVEGTRYMKALKDMVDKGYKIYGAIWTDKGLIYVAKLNEKGELELL